MTTTTSSHLPTTISSTSRSISPRATTTRIRVTTISNTSRPRTTGTATTRATMTQTCSTTARARTISTSSLTKPSSNTSKTRIRATIRGPTTMVAEWTSPTKSPLRTRIPSTPSSDPQCQALRAIMIPIPATISSDGPFLREIAISRAVLAQIKARAPSLTNMEDISVVAKPKRRIRAVRVSITCHLTHIGRIMDSISPNPSPESQTLLQALLALIIRETRCRSQASNKLLAMTSSIC
mmetsp:Transcript_36579/g.44651  ORF Transcript_36579/g.44651 Transcript_36579/m.44651 type:complete len:238 (-) Transcript_36579:591-1304(-)